MKYYGNIGFVESVESPEGSGIWVEVATERPYFGDVSEFSRRWAGTDNLNDELSLQNEISIISDSFIKEHLSNLRYIIWMGTAWKIVSSQMLFPRIKLTIGGVYNGPRPSSESETEVTS